MPANGEVPQPSQKEVLTPKELKGGSRAESQSGQKAETGIKPPDLARELHDVAGHPILPEDKLQEVLKGGSAETPKEDRTEAPLRTLKATKAEEKTASVSPKKPESTFTAEELEARARQGEEGARAAGGTITSPEAITQAATHSLEEAEKMRVAEKAAEKQIEDALKAGKVVFEDETGKTEFKVVGEKTHGGVRSLVLQIPGTQEEFTWRPGSKEHLGYKYSPETGNTPESEIPSIETAVRTIMDSQGLEYRVPYNPEDLEWKKLNKAYDSLIFYVDNVDVDPEILRLRQIIGLIEKELNAIPNLELRQHHEDYDRKLQDLEDLKIEKSLKEVQFIRASEWFKLSQYRREYRNQARDIANLGIIARPNEPPAGSDLRQYIQELEAYQANEFRRQQYYANRDRIQTIEQELQDVKGRDQWNILPDNITAADLEHELPELKQRKQIEQTDRSQEMDRLLQDLNATPAGPIRDALIDQLDQVNRQITSLRDQLEFLEDIYPDPDQLGPTGSIKRGIDAIQQDLDTNPDYESPRTLSISNKELEERSRERVKQLIEKYGGKLEGKVLRNENGEVIFEPTKEEEEEVRPKESIEERLAKLTLSFGETLIRFKAATYGSPEKKALQEEIESYLEIGNELGLFDLDKDEIIRQFDEYRQLAHGDRMGWEILGRRYRKRSSDGTFFDENGQTVSEQEVWDGRLMSIKKYENQLLQDENNTEKLSGILTFYNQIANDQISRYFFAQGRLGDMRARNYSIKGEWSLSEHIETEEEKRKAALWEIYQGTYYLIHATNPEEFQDVIDSFIDRQLIRGGIGKSAEELMRIKEYFTMALVGQAAKVADNLSDEDNEQIVGIKRQFEARIFAYMVEYFNKVDNADFASQILQAWGKDEGPERWKELIRTREGKAAYVVHLLDQDPRMNAYFRSHGARGQLMGMLDVKFFLEGHVLEQIIDEVVGIELNTVTFDAQGNPIVTEDEEGINLMYGELAQRANLEKIGKNQSKKSFKRLFRGKRNDGEDMTAREFYTAHKDNQEIIQTEADRRFFRIGYIQSMRDQGKQKELSESDRHFYDKLRREAKDAVLLGMQIYSAVGEKTLRGGPSHLAKRKEKIVKTQKKRKIAEKDEHGNPKKDKFGVIELTEKTVEVDLITVQEADYLPDFMDRSFLIYAENRAKREYAELGFTRDQKDGGESLYLKFLKDARINAVKTLDKRGFGAKLLYDSNWQNIKLNVDNVLIVNSEEAGQYNFVVDADGYALTLDENGEVVRAKNSSGNEYIQTAQNSNGRNHLHTIDPANIKQIGLLEAYDHPLGHTTNHTYLAHEEETANRLVSKQNRALSQQILDGLVQPDEVDILASYLLEIDPTLARTDSILDNDTLDIDRARILIHAAIQESRNTEMRVRETLQSRFGSQEGNVLRTIYHTNNFDSAMKPLLYPIEFADTDKARWARRGRFLLKHLPLYFSSLPDEWGLKGVMELVNIMERGSEAQASVHKPILDWIELFRYGVRMDFANQVKLALFGGIGKDGKEVIGLLEKPTNDADVLRKFGNLIEIWSEQADPEFEKHTIEYDQLYRQTFGRLEDTVKLIRIFLAQHTSSQGAIDAETEEVFNSEREYIFTGNIGPGASSSSSRHVINRFIDVYREYTQSEAFAISYPEEAQFYSKLDKRFWDWLKGKLSR